MDGMEWNGIEKERKKRMKETKAYIEDVGDALGLEELGSGGIVVAAEVEEIGEDLRGEGAGGEGEALGGGGHPVAADPADFALLVLVVVPTNTTRVLSLPLPHPLLFLKQPKPNQKKVPKSQFPNPPNKQQQP